MSWAATAEHERFDEAVDWFRQRVPYTHEQLGKLDDKARANAFWIAGALELSAVQTVFDEIAASLEKGGSLEDFKRSIREKLGAKFGVEGYHLETVFRNATQTAYGAGRWYQMQDPELRGARPYGLVDAILDARTTLVCKTLNGTIKALEDPWWMSNWTPYHHRCRTSIRSLTRREALRRGITQGTPTATPDKGFGLAPPARGDQPPKPDLARVTPEVQTAYKAREEQMQRELAEAQRKAEEKRRLQDPKHWFESEYRDKYGQDAGRAVAWGRAMEERGKDVSLVEAKRQHADLEGALVTVRRAGAPLFKRLQAAIDDGHVSKDIKTLGDAIGAMEVATSKTPSLKATLDDLRALAAMIGHRSGIQAAGDSVKLPLPRYDADVPADVKSKSIQELATVKSFWSSMSDRSLVLGDKRNGVQIRWTTKRGGYDQLARVITTSAARDDKGDVVDYGGKVIIHEMGHGLEEFDRRAHANAHEFYERRTHGKPLRKLRDVTGNPGYRDDEVVREGGFFTPYFGKEYGFYPGTTVRSGTEISAMSIEYLCRAAGELRGADEDTFRFALGQLAGDSAR